MQILSDTDTDLTDSFLLTPQSSDSDFDELLESDSLGERSTTSTVPTHNSSFPRLQHHILSRLSFTNLTGLATEMSGRDQIGMYSQSAMLYIRRLVWASVAVAGVATLVAAVFARDTSSQQVFYKYLGYQSWCISSSSLCTSILTRIHPIMSYLATFELRILKKRKLLTHLLCSKYPISPTSFTCIPPEYPAQAYLAFTTSLRELLYTAGQIFAAVVVLNLLSARTRSSSIAAVPNAITSGRIADGGFALADEEYCRWDEVPSTLRVLATEGGCA
ncbi:hypothetical protein Dda_0248 [Drechslerella dactyloides]|uniref:Uncharacterized protein n=1 Tax=Drechslerella dactyloides TaxID=74499 RepID=A0AAD6J7M8_DREDA|nr:hypothetical protein Dda_0248 [Drechslerella dactyloides]